MKAFKDTAEGETWKCIEIDGISALAKRDKNAPSFAKWSIIEAETGLSLLPPSWRGGLSAETLEGARYIVQAEVIDKMGKDKVIQAIQAAIGKYGIHGNCSHCGDPIYNFQNKEREDAKG